MEILPYYFIDLSSVRLVILPDNIQLNTSLVFNSSYFGLENSSANILPSISTLS